MLRSPVLRAIAAVVFFGAMFVVVPEGLAAAWASELSHQGRRPRLRSSLHHDREPGRCRHRRDRRRPPGSRRPPDNGCCDRWPYSSGQRSCRSSSPHSVAVIAGWLLISSFAVAGLTAPANGLFVQALPAEFRARAFGVMQAGLLSLQGAGLLAAGYIASHVEVSTAVTIFSAIGVCVMIGISVLWPSPERVDETIASVRTHNAVTIAAVDGRRPRHAAPEGPNRPRHRRGSRTPVAGRRSPRRTRRTRRPTFRRRPRPRRNRPHPNRGHARQ